MENVDITLTIYASSFKKIIPNYAISVHNACGVGRYYLYAEYSESE